MTEIRGKRKKETVRTRASQPASEVLRLADFVVFLFHVHAQVTTVLKCSTPMLVPWVKDGFSVLCGFTLVSYSVSTVLRFGKLRFV